MIVKEDVSLAAMTTFRMGGTAERLWVPESVDDLALLPSDAGMYRVISAGSNLLVSERKFDNVVSMGAYDRSIAKLEDGRWRVGCSVRCQAFIRAINNAGFGGVEELVSIPALVGGLVCMNASVPSANVCISDHLVEVEAYVDGEVRRFSREECGFGYRTSVFQDGRHIILSAIFEFPRQDPEVSKRRRAARIEHVRTAQDRSAPNFGSVFKRSDRRIMALVRRLGFRCGGAAFSKVAPNWLLNESASFEDADACLRRVQTMHRLLHRPCELEVVIWR